jgi:hydrogenase expression/formation protein HypD
VKHVDEYRDPDRVRHLADALARTVRSGSHWTIMEVCGGQTHSIVRFGLDRLLPGGVELVHGPGCPVCVTPLEILDRAHAIAKRPGVVFCSFGDMLRVPGSHADLFSIKAKGGDVRIVYSPVEAVELAAQNPDKHVVFLAVGFETTAPANAMAAHLASERGLDNFSLLVSHVLVPPAIEAVLSSPQNRVQGFLAAGHVCTVMGTEEYEPLARRYRVPIVVTGFEPVDILQGLVMCVAQLEDGRHEVENQYARSVKHAGNAPARAMLERVFEVVDRPWRGLGVIPRSGLGLAPDYARYDALKRFDVDQEVGEVVEPAECISGKVLQGIAKPCDCSAFGTRCTPEKPLGAPMVSSEGACAAYYRYRPDLVAQHAT